MRGFYKKVHNTAHCHPTRRKHKKKFHNLPHMPTIPFAIFHNTHRALPILLTMNSYVDIFALNQVEKSAKSLANHFLFAINKSSCQTGTNENTNWWSIQGAAVAKRKSAAFRLETPLLNNFLVDATNYYLIIINLTTLNWISRHGNSTRIFSSRVASRS